MNAADVRRLVGIIRDCNSLLLRNGGAPVAVAESLRAMPQFANLSDELLETIDSAGLGDDAAAARLEVLLADRPGGLN
jgi:hypothetical protein